MFLQFSFDFWWNFLIKTDFFENFSNFRCVLEACLAKLDQKIPKKSWNFLIFQLRDIKLAQTTYQYPIINLPIADKYRRIRPKQKFHKQTPTSLICIPTLSLVYAHHTNKNPIMVFSLYYVV